MIKVVAKCTVKVEKVGDFKDLTAALIDKTRKEDGCISYELFNDNNDPAVFVFVESWENEKKLNNHIESSHCREVLPEMEKTYEKDMELNFMSLVL